MLIRFAQWLAAVVLSRAEGAWSRLRRKCAVRGFYGQLALYAAAGLVMASVIAIALFAIVCVAAVEFGLKVLELALFLTLLIR